MSDAHPGIFVGVDSGGTRTTVHLAARTTTGRALTPEPYATPASLSGALPIDQLLPTLDAILAPLAPHVAGADLAGLPIHVWISAAGYTPWNRESYLAALERVVPTLLAGRVRSMGVANDVVTLLLGSRADVAIIAGTGSNVLVRGDDGLLHQSGGQEWVASDDGSGFWIGLRGIREAYRALERGDEDSPLLASLCATYDVPRSDREALDERLRRLAVATGAMKREVARFAEQVCGAAERGDARAQRIVKREAEGLSDLVATLLRRSLVRAAASERPLRLVECGGMFRSAFYRACFEGCVEGGLVVEWTRLTTGADCALALARDLATDAVSLRELAPAFRPAVVMA